MSSDIAVSPPPDANIKTPRTAPATRRQLCRLYRCRCWPSCSGCPPTGFERWIRSGEMAAINTSSVRCAKPRFVVLPGQLAAWQERHLAATPAKPGAAADAGNEKALWITTRKQHRRRVQTGGSV